MSLMATIPPPAPTFNRLHAERALHFTAERFKRDDRWQNALAKAWAYLDAGGWQWDGRTLLARSSDGTRRYTATKTSCDCRAGQLNLICYHAAAARVLVKAHEYATFDPDELTD